MFVLNNAAMAEPIQMKFGTEIDNDINVAVINLYITRAKPWADASIS